MPCANLMPCPFLFVRSGVFCCGPVPVRAVKEGDLSAKFDAPFVYAEVNADVVDYLILSNDKVVKAGGSTTRVGQCISTKAVGSDEREDITHLYKYPEGKADMLECIFQWTWK